MSLFKSAFWGILFGLIAIWIASNVSAVAKIVGPKVSATAA